MTAAARSARGPARVVGRAALLVAALAAVGIFHVWSYTRVTAAGYRLGELQRTQESLRAERNRLEVEVATLRAPGRLESFARARLGMAPPAPGAVVAGRTGVAAWGGAGRAGGSESLRLAPAEPAVRGVSAKAEQGLRPQASGLRKNSARLVASRPEA
jgi:cell division protein FtsL